MDGTDCVPSLFALDHTVLCQHEFRIVEYSSCGLKVQAAVLRLVDSILALVPFEAHRNTKCITFGDYKSTRKQ